MDPVTIIETILAAARAANEARTIWNQFHDQLSEQDQDKLKSALNELGTANDALYEEVSAKLDAAANAGQAPAQMQAQPPPGQPVSPAISQPPPPDATPLTPGESTEPVPAMGGETAAPPPDNAGGPATQGEPLGGEPAPVTEETTPELVVEPNPEPADGSIPSPEAGSDQPPPETNP